ncbi:MAG TPA: murein transglycosylase [Nitrospiraceae bacterium]|nr:MAG: hypothetical protein A2Z82_02565 [Nitrospirae bacterium GWA2_46_11]OGW23114.1 MAG: hypothetical protein A2X55_09065 [Nitrospirae bacterium GWB2_47_37]HAK87661.1 murein transglycosylase [Nitrospiraceae bacterium]HCL80942.1 murein transglycosylase [Nitrospiraceae bacterium]
MNKVLSIIIGVTLFSSPLFANEDPFCFSEGGAKYDIDPMLLQVISKVESNHNNEALNYNSNGTFDFCHMQINSGNYRSLGHEKWMSIADPCKCTKVGAEILKKCIEKHGYVWEAVGCYNAVSKGKRIKYAWKVFNELKRTYAAQNK